MSKFHPLDSRSGSARDARRDRAHLRRACRSCATAFRFVQGQHLTLRADIDGEDVRRSYSICSAVQDGDFAHCGEEGARAACSRPGPTSTCAPGQTIDVMPPMGHFNVPLDRRQPQALRRLRRRQRHHAAAVDRQDDAAVRAAQPVHAVLRQSLVERGDVQGGAGRPQGQLPRALQPGLRDEPRAAGHRDPERSHRRARRPTRCSSTGSTWPISIPRSSAVPTA